MTTLVTVAVLGAMGVRLVVAERYVWSAVGRQRTAEIVRGLRWRHLVAVPLVLAVVLLAAALLMSIPGLDWGWWSSLGGDGTPVLGTTSTTADTPWEWVLPVAFCILLIPALPLFAEAEERLFRQGAERWSWARRAAKTVAFGLVHALIGIPLGAALALTTGGAYFMWRYLRSYAALGDTRAATLESTRAHLGYNLVILSMVAAWAISTALGSA